MPLLDTFESLEFLKKFKLPTVKYGVAQNIDEAKKLALNIGFPIVLKIVSKEITHKTDVGGVKLNIKNMEELEESWNELIKIPKVEGILVEEQYTGFETIIGIKKDKIFGQVVMFGIGGIFVEILNDVSFRICPVEKEEAMKMIKEIKAYPLLSGFRGRKFNLEFLSEIISKVSKIAVENNIKELDVNPFTLSENEGKIVDARIII